jgi:hypothetical protein
MPREVYFAVILKCCSLQKQFRNELKFKTQLKNNKKIYFYSSNFDAGRYLIKPATQIVLTRPKLQDQKPKNLRPRWESNPEPPVSKPYQLLKAALSL